MTMILVSLEFGLSGLVVVVVVVVVGVLFIPRPTKQTNPCCKYTQQSVW